MARPLDSAAFFTVSLVAVALLTGSEAAPPDRRLDATQGIVVSVSAPASDVGLAVLRGGGNAVDAAVATAFALAVTWPAAGNIGGGGFMMVHPAAGQRPVCVEYRETAPAAAHVRMLEEYSRSDGPVVCGTPGTVAGLALAHRTYGKTPWQNLVLPAVRLAREGVVVSAPLASSLNGILRKSGGFSELQRVFAPPTGKEWRTDDRLIQPDLARTLERIATEGPQAFYTGMIADQIVAEMQAGGGLITKQDLAGYQAHVREPIHGTYRGYDVYAPPPPSSGGICLVEMLNILENFSLHESPAELSRGGQEVVWPARTMHLMIEAMRRAYCDRARWLGDSDFVSIPPELTTKEYARQLAHQIDPQRHTPSESLAADVPLANESPETTHFSVLDRDGMAVANTYTLEDSFGCRVVVRGAGFLLNNEMIDFNRVPGRTDRQGMIGTPANLIAPGKRMLSSQTPTLMFRDGQLVLVTGSPGGRTIINTVLCTIVGWVDFQRDPRAVIDTPRLHHQWFPDRVGFEGLARPEYAAALAELRRLGHTFADKPGKQGDAHSIGIDPQTGVPCGVPDRRIDGHAAGM